jgi:hypothetical protein
MGDILKLINNNLWIEAYNNLKINNKLYEQILDGKNLFHIACIRGNKNIIYKYVNQDKDKILISDNDNNSGAHLLAINGFDNLLCDLCEELPDFLSLKNNDDKFLINYVIDRDDTILNIYNLMKNNNYLNLLNIVRYDDSNIVMDIIDKINDDNINKIKFNILKDDNIDWSQPKSNPALIYILGQNKINLFKKILKIPKINVNIISSGQMTPLIYASLKNDYDISKKLIKLGADVNYGGAENGFLPINISIKNKNIKLLNLFSQIKNIDFNKKDDILNTPIYYLIEYISTNIFLYENDNNEFSLKKLLEIFVKNTNIFSKNANNISAFDLLHKFDLYRDIEHLVKNNNNNDKSKIENKIILPEITQSNYGLFNPDSVHNIIYSIYIIKKYNNAIFPFQYPIKEKQIWEKQYIFFIDPSMKTISESVNLHHDFFYLLLPSIIYWIDKEKYYKTKNIEFYIQRALSLNNIRFVILKISLVPQITSFHANIVIFDKKENKIIRFEPYGDWEIVDSYHLDKMIYRIFEKVTNAKLKYIRPGDYLHNPKFQTASEGDYKKNLGDPIGYCLAWCYWFIELKLKNPDIEEKNLVENALENILEEKKIACDNDTNCLLGYIRGYGRKLDQEKNQILKEIGIDTKEIYGTSYSTEKLNKIKNYVEKLIVEDVLQR